MERERPQFESQEADKETGEGKERKEGESTPEREEFSESREEAELQKEKEKTDLELSAEIDAAKEAITDALWEEPKQFLESIIEQGGPVGERLAPAIESIRENLGSESQGEDMTASSGSV